MKTLVVSKRKLNLHNLETVPNIRSASSREGITNLVYVDSEDGYNDLLTEIVYMSIKVEKIIYINSTINHFIKYIVQLCGGYVIVDDGSYLEEDTLEWIVQDIGTTGLEEKTTTEDLTKLTSTVGKLLSMADNKQAQEIVNMIFNTSVRKSLQESLQAVVTAKEIEKKTEDNLKKTLRGVRSSVLDLQKDKDDFKSQLEEIKEVYSNKLDEVERGGIDMFPVHTVHDNGSKVMYVRAYSPCRFLTTFLLSFTHYLRNEKNKDTKLLIVTSKQIAYTKKFGVFTRIHSDNAHLMDFSKHNVYVTSEPKKAVFDAFFRKREVKVFIVLDYTYNDRLLKGTSVKAFGAVGGYSDFQIFDLEPKTTFTSQFLAGRSLLLKPIQSYLKMNEQQRIKAMMDSHITLYNHICSVLEV